MFETDLILFLQSFAGDGLTFLFRMFTELGRIAVIIPVIIALTVGVHLRMGILVMHTSLWTGVLTFFLKDFFGLPRPVNVDNTIHMLVDGSANPSPFKDMGADGFFKGLPQQVIDYFRAHRLDSFGFPSGHSSSTVALWGWVFLYFRKSWVRAIAVIMLIMIPLSRLYLGRHFPADVLGGLTLGCIVLSAFYGAIWRNTALMDYLLYRKMVIQRNLKTILLAIYFLVLPFLLFLVPMSGGKPGDKIVMISVLLGMNLGFLLLWKRGLPLEGGSFEQRALRILLALAFFAALRFLFKGLTGLLVTPEPVLIRFIRLTITFCLSLWGGIELAIKLKLYTR